MRERHVFETDTRETDSLGYLIAGIDQTNRKTDRQTERMRQRDKETERQRDRERERER